MIPYYVDTRFTPPRKGLIDDVVVDQTGGVNHLRNHGDLSLCVHHVAGKREGGKRMFVSGKLVLFQDKQQENRLY